MIKSRHKVFIDEGGWHGRICLFYGRTETEANAVDLEDFLSRQGEKLLRSGREKRLASDHSITVRGNRWYDHATEKGAVPLTLCGCFITRAFRMQLQCCLVENRELHTGKA